MGVYINQTDAENAMSPRTLLACYNDTGDNTVNYAALEATIDRAEAMVDSYVIPDRALPVAGTILQAASQQPDPPKSPTDRLLKNAALQFFIAYSWARHPEYVKLYRGGAEKLEKDANDLMLRIQQGTQELPDTETQDPAGNSGGFSYDASHRIFIDNASGPPFGNTGDF